MILHRGMKEIDLVASKGKDLITNHGTDVANLHSVIKYFADWFHIDFVLD